MLVMLFSVMIPIGTAIYCMSFCCARTFVERCHCCCALCKQPNCGSPKPTEDYKGPEKVCVSVCLVFMLLIFITISIIGFLSTMQMATDFQEIIANMDSAMGFPDEWSDTLNASFLAIGQGHMDVAGRINSFTSQQDALQGQAVALNNSVKSLITKWQTIGRLIEGTHASGAANPCSFYYNSSIAVRYDGDISAWTYNYTSPLGAIPLPGVKCCEAVNISNCVRGYHAVGRGTVVAPSNRPSPTCSRLRRDGLPHNGTVVDTPTACPCCCTCQVTVTPMHC
jgi:hypothetical protein